MIAYEELERALARWKARHTGGAAATPEAAVPDLAESAAAARSEGARAATNGERTGEVDVGDVVEESYDEAP